MVTNYLPGCDCVDVDCRNNYVGPMDMRFLKGQYIQPELRDKELYPTNASLERQLHFGMISSRKQENAISDAKTFLGSQIRDDFRSF